MFLLWEGFPTTGFVITKTVRFTHVWLVSQSRHYGTACGPRDYVALLLAAISKSESQFGWLIPAMWAGLCVLLSGRRKMMGIPMVFLGTFLMIGWYLGLRRMHRLVAFSVSGILIAGFFAVLFWSTDQSDEYTDYASTLFTQGLERSNEMIVGSTIGTLQQAGVLGAGLGSGTQGRHYVAEASEGPRTWQEDV